MESYSIINEGEQICVLVGYITTSLSRSHPIKWMCFLSLQTGSETALIPGLAINVVTAMKGSDVQ